MLRTLEFQRHHVWDIVTAPTCTFYDISPPLNQYEWAIRKVRRCTGDSSDVDQNILMVRAIFDVWVVSFEYIAVKQCRLLSLPCQKSSPVHSECAKEDVSGFVMASYPSAKCLFVTSLRPQQSINLLLLRVALTTSWLGLALALLGLPGLLRCLLSSDGLGTVVLRHGLDNGLLLLGLDDGNGVGESLGWAGLAFGVGAAHDLNLDTEHTLAEQDVAGGVVDEVLGRLTGVDHETVLDNVSMSLRSVQRVCTYGELHALGTGGPELSGNDDLATLGARLHDEPQHTVASPSDGQTIEKLVSEGLALGDGGETTVLDLGGVQGNGVLGELEALLDERGELTDAATLLSENLLGVCGADDDVGDGGGDADLDAGVALLGQLALEELVQLGVENTVCEGSC